MTQPVPVKDAPLLPGSEFVAALEVKKFTFAVQRGSENPNVFSSHRMRTAQVHNPDYGRRQGGLDWKRGGQSEFDLGE